jgi:cytochrome c oxidase assembly protein subunit 11
MYQAPQSDDVADRQVGQRNNRLGAKLGLVAVFMIGMSPVMYMTGGMICDWAGLGFNPDGIDMASEGESKGRVLDCVFTAMVADELADQVRFEVTERKQDCVVGDPTAGRNLYTIENVSDQPVFIRPIHYVSPPQASQKFRMTECFCYNDMELAPGERRELTVVYGFKADLDARVSQALINYSLEPITEADLRPVITMPKQGMFAPPAVPATSSDAPVTTPLPEGQP